MELRQAEIHEGDKLYGWILQWAAWFARKGVEQWNPLYPKRLFVKELTDGSVHCLGRADDAVGMVTIFSAPPFYHPKDVWDEEPAWYLSRVVIPKERSGTGVGADLMKAVEAAAQAQGRRRLRIDVVRTNPALIEIWKGFGFHVVKDALIRGTDCAFMEKTLQPTVKESVTNAPTTRYARGG